MANKLFAEFPPVSTEKWEEVIIKDLKGADYEKKLVWKTQEGFSVRPYYRAENLKNLKYLGALPGEFPFIRGTKKDNNWLIRQDYYLCEGVEKANAQALDGLQKGVEAVGFRIDGDKGISEKEMEILLNGISIEAIEINFCCCRLRKADIIKSFIKVAKAQGVKPEELNASFDFNPLHTLTTKGYLCMDDVFEPLKKCIEAVAEYPNIRVINVEGYDFNNAGSSITQELAFSLAIGSEYLYKLTELGVSAKEIAKRIKFTFAVGGNYFMEIAKFRAARLLWSNIVKTYGSDSKCSQKMKIHAITSSWNQTVYDAYVNMLRGTTEAMSAAISGVDSLEVIPFDYAFHTPEDFSNRIARNTQSILKEEAHFDKIVDPAAGSYFVENLTESIIEAAWTLFNKVEDKGGYIESFKEGFIQSEIKTVSDKKDKNIATRREIILGTNQYPNFLEKANKDIQKEVVCRGSKIPQINKPQIAKPLETYRAAQAFESLRFATDRSGKQPKVFMLTYGNLSMCRARAQFSSNFFAVAGFKVVDNNRFSTIEEGVEAALAAKADIVVACSSDEEYADAVPQIAKLIGNKAVVVVAGDPECKDTLASEGITNFINVKCNVLETLKEYQVKMGIKEL
ncbi:MAG: methylmalonyl-CoA mutase family protein [Bacteroidales bacterium]|nr:methylmalonyl-CoA mutase family protein [Bacteroidales bacterium]